MTSPVFAPQTRPIRVRGADTLELLDSKHHTALHVCAMRDSAQAAKARVEEFLAP